MTKNLLYIGNALSRKGATVTSVEIISGLLQKENYNVRVYSNKRLKIVRMLDMIFNTLRYAGKSDVVLIDTYSTTNFWYAVIIGKLCTILSLPYIPILRGGNLPNRIQNYPTISKKLFSKAKTNIAPSNYIISSFKRQGITNLTYIPNSIETSKYTFKKRAKISPKLLWVRSFSEIYNPIMALKVLKNLLNTFPDASLTMVGPEKDASFEECNAFAKANNLPVTFTGMLSKEDWWSLAQKHDLFINTTNFDNTPVSVIEAMALGLPVVSTNVGGMPFLIDHEKDGLLVPKGDILIFEQSLIKLLQDPELCERLSSNGRKKAERFNWETVKLLWEEVLS